MTTASATGTGADQKNLGVAIIHALFMALGYITAVGIPLALDPRLRSSVFFSKSGLPTYRYEWLILGLALVVGSATFMAILQRRRTFTLFGPCIALALCLGAAMLVLKPFPNGHLLWGFTYGVAYFVSCWCRFQSEEPDCSRESDAPVKWSEDSANSSVEFWRSVTIGMGAAYLATTLSWFHNSFEITGGIFTDPLDRMTAFNAEFFSITLFSLYVIVGPFREAMSQWRNASNRLTRPEVEKTVKKG